MTRAGIETQPRYDAGWALRAALMGTFFALVLLVELAALAVFGVILYRGGD